MDSPAEVGSKRSAPPETSFAISWKVLLAYGIGSMALDALSNPQTILPLALAPWTPPPGLTLAFLLLYGLHYAPFLIVVTFLAGIPLYGLPAEWLPALWAATLLMLGLMALAAWLLRGLRFDPQLSSQRDLSWFLLVAVLAAWLDSGVHVFSRSPEAAPDVWAWLADLVNYWVGALIRLLVIAPLVLVHARDDWNAFRPEREMVLQALAIALALWVIFALKYTDEFKFFYLLFLPLIWTAMRYGIQGATVALAACHIGINAILEWRGLQVVTVVEFQMLMLGLAVTGLFLGLAVSTRRAAEERLLQREAELNQAMRLAAAGEMAQAIAHELNQPLVAVANYARAGRSMLQDPARHAELLADTLDKIDREANRAGRVMRRLREFFRGGGLRPESFTAQALVEESLAHVRRRTERQGIAVQTLFEPGLPRLYADRVQMGTVLHNLLANAVESLGEQPSLWRDIKIEVTRHGADQVCVCVADNGPGVRADMEDKLFDSFATSKTEGMGLGLAISRTLVEAHGGRLWLDRARPARFCFTLPTEAVEPSTADS
ncbi:MAG: ATP-binding protein [Thiobacillaceae bacterium]|nr:ATP-binding protein [Thiobacillaceae bacterium]